jgi:hypothetical protein
MLTSARRDWFPAVLCAVLAGAAVRLWIQPMGNRFWLDETLIVWTIRDGAARIVPHAFISLQSIAFCALEWLVMQAGGAREAILRLPSTAAAIATLYVYYRIGTEAVDRELGLILPALYMAMPSVALEASTARPYALALLAHAAALLWLLRWLRSGRLRDGVWWAVCAAAACHFHQLFAIAVPLEGVVVLWRVFKGGAVTWRQFVLCALGLAILLLPAIPQALVMRRMGRLLSFAAQPTAITLVMPLAPIGLLFAAALVAAAAWAAGKSPGWARPNSGVEAAWLGAVLLIVPAAGFFALSRLTEIRLFESRYLLPAAPGFVLFWGWLLRCVQPAGVRRISLVASLAISVLLTAGLSPAVDYRREDWRSAVRSLPDSGAMLVYSGLVETRHLNWLQAPERWGYLAAPVDVYRPGLSPQDAFLVPFDFDSSGRAYVERLAAGLLPGRDTIAVIARRSFSGPAWVSWLSQFLAGAGFAQTRRAAYGAVEVRVFERSIRRAQNTAITPVASQHTRPRWTTGPDQAILPTESARRQGMPPHSPL